MITFQSVTPLSSLNWSICGGYDDPHCKYYSLEPPPSTTSSYDPLSLDSWRIEPDEEMSFKKVKHDRLIKMTPLSVGKIRTYDSLVSLPHRMWSRTHRGQEAGFEYNSSTRSYDEITPMWFSGYYDKTLEYTTHEPYPAFRNARLSWPYLPLETTADSVASKLNHVSGDVVSDLGSSFDLLTEMAEFPDVLRLVVDVLYALKNPVKGVRDLIRRYKKARAKGMTHLEVSSDLSDEWLKYRYAIMPLVYSFRDLVDLLDQQAVEFKTERARDEIDMFSSRRADAMMYDHAFYEEGYGSIIVSAVGKARYDNSQLRLADQINFNWFTTAWELIPFSFIVDWFLNVGDVIASHTSMLGSLAVQTKYCRSIRKKYTVQTRIRSTYTDSYSKTLSTPYVYTNPNTGSSIVVRPAYSYSQSQDYELDLLGRTVEYDTYDRTIFHPGDVGISFSPSLSWMRELDALSLSLKKLRNFF